MKTILTLLTILGAQFIAAPSAEARDRCNSHRYVSSRTSCGCPVYTVRYIAYYDRCGYPVYRYRTEPVRHRCRSSHYHRPVIRQNHYNSSRCGTPVRHSCGKPRGYTISRTHRGLSFSFYR